MNFALVVGNGVRWQTFKRNLMLTEEDANSCNHQKQIAQDRQTGISLAKIVSNTVRKSKLFILIPSRYYLHYQQFSNES